MAFFDWNRDGKKDIFDEMVEFEIYRKTTSKEHNTSSSYYDYAGSSVQNDEDDEIEDDEIEEDQNIEYETIKYENVNNGNTHNGNTDNEPQNKKAFAFFICLSILGWIFIISKIVSGMPKECRYPSCDNSVVPESNYCIVHKARKSSSYSTTKSTSSSSSSSKSNSSSNTSTKKSSSKSSNSKNKDSYNAKDYSSAEDFYEDNYDDFDGYEDAEDYYDEWGE